MSALAISLITGALRGVTGFVHLPPLFVRAKGCLERRIIGVEWLRYAIDPVLGSSHAHGSPPPDLYDALTDAENAVWRRAGRRENDFASSPHEETSLPRMKIGWGYIQISVILVKWMRCSGAGQLMIRN
jgi:hypothetical protein